MAVLQLNHNKSTQWLEKARFMIEPRTGWISFKDSVEGDTKTWQISGTFPGLVSFLFELLHKLPTGPNVAIFRRRGDWTYPILNPDDPRECQVNGQLYDWIITKLGVCSKKGGLIVLSRDALLQAAWLVAILQGYSWSTNEDLALISESGAFLIEISHHDLITIEFARREVSGLGKAISDLAEEYDYLPVSWTGD